MPTGACHPSTAGPFHGSRARPTAAIAGGGAAPDCEGRDLGGLDIPRPEGGSASFGDWLGETFTDGLAVMKEGRLLTELYPGDLAAGRPHIVFSVSKSITAIVAGVLAGEGLIDPQWPVTRLIPEAKAPPMAMPRSATCST